MVLFFTMFKTNLQKIIRQEYSFLDELQKLFQRFLHLPLLQFTFPNHQHLPPIPSQRLYGFNIIGFVDVNFICPPFGFEDGKIICSW
ncbi:MAG: hypothetical protein K2X48_13120 [Chitinophagaceae bacterium]|nr:hypothetical protein [Chitinophagaceae bacterium]